MSNPEIFIVGAVITILVAIALVPLIWAAVLDGRDEQEFRAGNDERAHDAPAEVGA